MLHRAILGSFERFLGILIEQHAGRFPLWLRPVQAVVATIVDDATPFAREAAEAMAQAGLRVDLDLRNEKINRKVVDHIDQRVPVLAVIGRREAEERSVVLRRLPGREQETLPLAEAVARMAAEAKPPA
jgi:threonyl-tRNA synthetase